jgi:hypothetical protein
MGQLPDATQGFVLRRVLRALLWRYSSCRASKQTPKT